MTAFTEHEQQQIRDGEKLPRRFRWQGAYCVLWPNGEIDCEDGDIYMHVPAFAEQWLREHAGEIEWIDP